jgi:hypothetical protein
METINRLDYAELAFHYQDPTAWYSADKCFVQEKKPTQQGKYRVGTANDYYKLADVSMPDMGYPKTIDQTDAFVEWDCTNKGLNVKLKQADLENFRSFGYQSAADMVQRKIEFLAHRTRIAKESAAVTFFETAANFDAANINAAGAVWTNKTGSNPITDVLALRAEVKHLTHMAFNYTTLMALMQHPVIMDYLTDSVDKSADPLIWAAKLESIFGLKIVLFAADVVADATLTPASYTKQQIFGNYVVFFNHNPAAGANPDVPTWAKEFVFDVPGLTAEGWLVQQTVDQRAGYTGVMDIDLKYCNQYKVYATSYAGKITGVY